MVRLGRLRARLAHSFAFEARPDFPFIRAPLHRALRGLLAAEDSEHKKAVVIGGSEALTGILGLKKTARLSLPYPDFTIENLALLSGEYDFVIADRVLHRCRSLDDAASETLRVLKPGGWFVHTGSTFDFSVGGTFDGRRVGSSGLRRLFAGTQSTADIRAGGNATASWIIGRKAATAPELVPTVATRTSTRPYYRFRPRKAKFGVMAMLRNEAPYLLEWIAYYRLLGFEQITLYDNQSNDASAEILAKLAGAGIINAVYWSDRRSKQLRAYNHAVRRLRPFVEWCLFADLDEYLVLDPGISLDGFLQRDADVMGISIPWRMFGSAGIRNRETGLTIERFTKVAQQISRHVKSIVRLKDVRFMGIHMPASIHGRLIDTQGTTITDRNSGAQPWVDTSPAWINHYFSRSWEEYESKRARGRGAVTGGFRSASQFDAWGSGETVNADILSSVPALRQEIARLRKIVG